MSKHYFMIHYHIFYVKNTHNIFVLDGYSNILIGSIHNSLIYTNVQIAHTNTYYGNYKLFINSDCLSVWYSLLSYSVYLNYFIIKYYILYLKTNEMRTSSQSIKYSSLPQRFFHRQICYVILNTTLCSFFSPRHALHD